MTHDPVAPNSDHAGSAASLASSTFTHGSAVTGSHVDAPQFDLSGCVDRNAAADSELADALDAMALLHHPEPTMFVGLPESFRAEATAVLPQVCIFLEGQSGVTRDGHDVLAVRPSSALPPSTTGAHLHRMNIVSYHSQ